MFGLDALISFLEAHALAAYAVLFVAMVIEGETFLIVSAVLAHLGALSLPLVAAIALVGVLIGDVLWYFLGAALKREGLPVFVLRLLSMAETVVRRLFPRFEERPILSLSLAKFVYGTNHATLIFAGYIRMHFPLFMKAEVIASVIWVAVFAAAGYLFGYVAIELTNRLSVFLLIIVALIALLVSLQKALALYYEKKKKNEI
ncbi:MAG: VTT domain-containing protein [bacterium]|nr:VTT domain-containing protein [bacterium]